MVEAELRSELDALIVLANEMRVLPAIRAQEQSCGKTELTLCASRLLGWLSEQASYSVERNPSLEEDVRRELLHQSGSLPEHIGKTLKSLPALSLVVGVEKRKFKFDTALLPAKKEAILDFVQQQFKPSCDRK